MIVKRILMVSFEIVFGIKKKKKNKTKTINILLLIGQLLLCVSFEASRTRKLKSPVEYGNVDIYF